MKISKTIEILQKISDKFGDIEITGGSMVEDRPLRSICVTEVDGMEIWPRNPNGLNLAEVKIDGIYLES